MDHFSYLIDSEHRLLLIGIVFLVVAAAFMVTGESLERYGGVVYRTKAP